MATFNDYLETFKGMAVEGAQTAVKKTRQLASVAKANLAIRTEEEKIKKAQIELGKLYYKDYIVGQTRTRRCIRLGVSGFPSPRSPSRT